jgi:hypothetical protein
MGLHYRRVYYRWVPHHMKTAVLISGHIRSFERCLPTQHWHVYRHFPGADFFVSTIEDTDAKKAELLRVKYPGARVEIEAVKEQPDCVAEMRMKGVELPASWQPPRGHPNHGSIARRDIEYFYTHEPYAISVHPQAVLRQLWQLQRCWELFTSKVAATDYDLIIRCRPDLYFHSFTAPDIVRMMQNETVIVDGDPLGSCTPFWGEFGGRNDRFALLSKDAAWMYFTTYARIPDLWEKGCPIHPESLIGASLEAHANHKLFAEFSTLRSDGQMRPPEITRVDLARLHAS